MNAEAKALMDKIRALGINIPEGARFVRTYAGRHQLSAGAWVWFIVDAHGSPLSPEVGSQFPRRDLTGGIAVSWDRYTNTWQVDPDWA